MADREVVTPPRPTTTASNPLADVNQAAMTIANDGD
jgi:hypothetical protein